MVEDRVTDGRRIAQLLASELTGLNRGPLDTAEVVDAERDVEPTSEAAKAYDVAVDGDHLATVAVTPSTVRVTLEGDHDLSLPDRDDGLALESATDGLVLVIENGAAVKRAVDVLTEGFE